MDDIRAWLEVHRVVNASGTMTSLGASSVPDEVAEIVRDSLSCFVEMAELQAYASETIARVCGAEAGCVTASAAAGIAVAVAACLTGISLGAAEALPDTDGLERTEVVIQKGHVVNYGASITQNIRLTGAQPREIGTATGCEGYQLRHALGSRTAAAVFVVSHHTVQSELLGFPDFVALCHDAGVPVIVDAASEYDLTTFLGLGADLVIYSGHKFLSGATAGILAGRLALVRACYLQQTAGLGRPMKVGKEGIVGVIAALTRWERLDHRALHAAEYRRTVQLERALGEVAGLRVSAHPDPTGNPITRLRVALEPSITSAPLTAVVATLAGGKPPIIVRSHHLDLGFFELDLCNVADNDLELIAARFRDLKALLGSYAPTETENDLGPRLSSYAPNGRPVADLSRVPWGFRRSADAQSKLEAWPTLPQTDPEA